MPSSSHAAWSFANGGVEHGAEHYKWMVLLHTAFLIAIPAEVILLEREWNPVAGWACVGLAVAAQAVRWWVITTLGPRWNTRVIVVPGLPPVTGGPYRYLNHPNYLAVILEGIALPLMHGAGLTAIAFLFLNAWLLKTRIAVEDRALGRAA